MLGIESKDIVINQNKSRSYQGYRGTPGVLPVFVVD